MSFNMNLDIKKMATIGLVYFGIIFLLLGCSEKYSQGIMTFKRPLAPILKQSSITEMAKLTETPATRPHIFMFFLDTVRRDAINEIDAPEMFAFMNESLSPEIALGGSTSTHNSIFSLFYSRPAYERIPTIQSEWSMGSPFLYILSHLENYRINAFGPPEYFFPLTSKVPATDVLTEDASNQLIFGIKTALVSNNFQDMGKNPYYSNTAGDIDRGVTDQVITKINEIKADSTNPYFVLIYLFSAHNPYSWASDMPSERILTPSFPLSGQLPPSYFLHGERPLAVNSYHNGVRNVDRQFGRIIAKLKKTDINLYNNSIIVVFADHGEHLGERGGFGHGGQPLKEVANIPIMIKPQSSYTGPMVNPSVASLVDLFPTIFDLLGLGGYIDSNLFFGHSLLSPRVKHSSIIVKPNMDKPTDEFALYNSTYKVFGKFQFTGSDIMNSHGFQIKSITDLDDREMSLGTNFDEVTSRVENDFSEVLRKMYTKTIGNNLILQK